jgi:hypothetical protein
VEQVILLRPPDRVRSRALAQLILVSILIAQHLIHHLDAAHVQPERPRTVLANAP